MRNHAVPDPVEAHSQARCACRTIISRVRVEMELFVEEFVEVVDYVVRVHQVPFMSSAHSWEAAAKDQLVLGDFGKDAAFR